MENSVTRAVEERKRNGPWEVEVTYEGDDDLLKLEKECRKYPNHEHFIPVDEFNKDHLPAECRYDDIVDLVRAMVDLTVRLHVKYVSGNRPDTYTDGREPYPCYKSRGSNMGRFGTGWVWAVRRRSIETVKESCRCSECVKSSTPKSEFAYIYFRTATHVVFDGLEGVDTTCSLFFDRGKGINECEGVVTLKGMTDVMSDTRRDYCLMRYATHDMVLADRIDICLKKWDSAVQTLRSKFGEPEKNKLTKLFSEDKLPEPMKLVTIIVSHPHGCSKQVTIGSCTEREQADQRRCRYRYTTRTCPGSSGAKVLVLGQKWWCRNTGHTHSAAGKDGLNYSCLSRD